MDDRSCNSRWRCRRTRKMRPPTETARISSSLNATGIVLQKRQNKVFLDSLYRPFSRGSRISTAEK
jgi:hypothetical protein